MNEIDSLVSTEIHASLFHLTFRFASLQIKGWIHMSLYFFCRCVHILYLSFILSLLFSCGISSQLDHMSVFALSALYGHSHTRNTHIVVTRVFSNASQMFNLSLHEINRLGAGDKDRMALF